MGPYSGESDNEEDGDDNEEHDEREFQPRRRPSVARLYALLGVLGAMSVLAVPSGVVRSILLIPVGTQLAQALPGLTPTQLRGAKLALLLTTLECGTGVLTGSSPNVVALAALSETSGASVTWATWAARLMLTYFLGQAILVFVVVFLLYGRKRGTPVAGQYASINDGGTEIPQPLAGSSVTVLPIGEPGEFFLEGRARQYQALLLLLAACAMWASDAAHSVTPAQVGLLVVLFLYMPYFGAVKFDSIRKVNFPVLFFIAAVLALGVAVSEDVLISCLRCSRDPFHFIDTSIL